MKALITGGTGSLGVALIPELQRAGYSVTVYSRDEVKQTELKRQFPDVYCVLGDVRDENWLELCMRRHELVVHAAAYKQVPSSEVNAGEAIETNVIGSRNVARAAVRAGVERVVGISTDKACAPVNCYGETKALMEKLFQQACLWGDTKFYLVRYGNVLGSRGSVVPLFQKQMAEGKVTVTCGEMTRFWLTLGDAVKLVQAAIASNTTPGSILIPKAPASNMLTLLDAVANTYGETTAHKHFFKGQWQVLPKFVVEDIGIRPGEKMHEQLIHRGESAHVCDTGIMYYILPAYTKPVEAMPAGFEYRSDTARTLGVSDLEKMLCSP